MPVVTSTLVLNVLASVTLRSDKLYFSTYRGVTIYIYKLINIGQ